MIIVREQRHDEVTSEQLWELHATFRAGVTVRTWVAEDNQLRDSKLAVKESLSMRRFVRNCGVDRMGPLVFRSRAA